MHPNTRAFGKRAAKPSPYFEFSIQRRNLARRQGDGTDKRTSDFQSDHKTLKVRRKRQIRKPARHKRKCIKEKPEPSPPIAPKRRPDIPFQSGKIFPPRGRFYLRKEHRRPIFPFHENFTEPPFQKRILGFGKGDLEQNKHKGKNEGKRTPSEMQPDKGEPKTKIRQIQRMPQPSIDSKRHKLRSGKAAASRMFPDHAPRFHAKDKAQKGETRRGRRKGAFPGRKNPKGYRQNAQNFAAEPVKKIHRENRSPEKSRISKRAFKSSRKGSCEVKKIHFP